MDELNPSDAKPDEASGVPPVAPDAVPDAPPASQTRGPDADRLTPLTFERRRAPENTDAWLHVVSGPAAPAVARAAVDLAARFMSGGQRVLIIDAGPRLALHRRFDREGRWGLVECLTGDMPVLGLVQDAGRPGLYLLAHGAPARRTQWGQLGRLLGEAQAHFGRAILTIDADAPAAIGEALAGWHLEGWWAAQGNGRQRALRVADRLGIHLSDLDLDAVPEARLEVLDARMHTLAARGAETTLPAIAEVAAPAATSAAAAAAPVVLTSDLHVRERLRFLLWMRRVRSEAETPGPAGAPATVSATASGGGA